MIGQLGRYGDANTIEEAQRRFTGYLSGSRTLPADLKTAVFSIALANGDEYTFDQLVQVLMCSWLTVV